MRRKRLLLAAALVLVILSRVPAGVYILSPGRALPVAPLVSVEGAAPGPGRFLMTTVATAETSVAGLLWHSLDPSAHLVPRRALLAGRTSEEFLADARREMAESQAVAAYVAFRHLGREAGLVGRGVRVLAVAEGSPADGVLRRGDVIVAARDRPVRFAEDLILEIPAGKGLLPLTVEREGRRRQVALSFNVEGFGPAQPVLPGLIPGLETATEGLETRFPVRVSVSAPEVAGPSAGLAFTLEIVDRLDPGSDPAGGRIVAATGAVWPSGRVVPVGGVRQKVLAARRAGADLVLVPAASAAEARAVAGPVRVVPVDTVADAIRALRIPGRR